MLVALEGTAVGPIRCEGTFYVWIRLPEWTTAERLLVEHRVAVAPGEGFGALGARWVRLSLAVSDEQLELGLSRLRAALYEREEPDPEQTDVEDDVELHGHGKGDVTNPLQGPLPR